MSNQGPKWASKVNVSKPQVDSGPDCSCYLLSQQHKGVTFSATTFFTHRQKEADHLGHRRKMKSQSSYAPPAYIPLGMSDSESAIVLRNEEPPKEQNSVDGPVQWSSGICACCDDMQSCCIGLFCPCFLFGKNAEFLGSGTFIGSCMTHFILWALINTVCCLLTEGLVLGVPGCFVACYACGYRRTLRSKYNLQEAPCGDFVTHFFCHLCAICQEYREMREKSADSGFPDLSLAIVTAPPVQTMEPGLEE